MESLVLHGLPVARSARDQRLGCHTCAPSTAKPVFSEHIRFDRWAQRSNTLTGISPSRTIERFTFLHWDPHLGGFSQSEIHNYTSPNCAPRKAGLSPGVLRQHCEDRQHKKPQLYPLILHEERSNSAPSTGTNCPRMEISRSCSPALACPTLVSRQASSLTVQQSLASLGGKDDDD
jgi:hypothetical protein